MDLIPCRVHWVRDKSSDRWYSIGIGISGVLVVMGLFWVNFFHALAEVFMVRDSADRVLDPKVVLISHHCKFGRSSDILSILPHSLLGYGWNKSISWSSTGAK